VKDSVEVPAKCVGSAVGSLWGVGARENNGHMCWITRTPPDFDFCHRIETF